MDGTGKMAWRGLWRESGVPLSWGGVGLRPLAFPPSSGLDLIAFGIPLPLSWGILPPAFPTPLPRGPLHNNRKKLKRAPFARPSCFLYTVIPYASKLATACQCTKKALKRCLRAFFCCCAVRGGFEPPVRLPVRQFSKLVVSATHPSHLSAQWVICLHKRFGTAKIC